MTNGIFDPETIKWSKIHIPKFYKIMEFWKEKANEMADESEQWKQESERWQNICIKQQKMLAARLGPNQDHAKELWELISQNPQDLKDELSGELDKLRSMVLMMDKQACGNDCGHDSTIKSDS